MRLCKCTTGGGELKNAKKKKNKFGFWQFFIHGKLLYKLIDIISDMKVKPSQIFLSIALALTVSGIATAEQSGTESYCKSNPIYLVSENGKAPVLRDAPYEDAAVVKTVAAGTRTTYNNVLVDSATGKATWYQLDGMNNAWIKASCVSCKRPVN